MQPAGSRAQGKGATVVLGALTFSAAFDSGHLGTVKRAADGAYEIALLPDSDADAYKVWYYFSVSGGQPGRRIKCRIVNMHPIASVYSKDLRPLVRVPSVSLQWERLQAPASFVVTPAFDLVLSFEYTFVTGPAAPVYFAFYYPFPYADCQRLLDNVDKALAGLGALTPASDAAALAAAPPDALYYARELLTLTPDGRRVELLTITSCAGVVPEEREPAIEGLFPQPPGAGAGPSASGQAGAAAGAGAAAATSAPPSSSQAALVVTGLGAGSGGASAGSSGSPPPPASASPVALRPHRFRGKPGVFVSARVHPAETAASYMLHGLLALLLQPRNSHARALREGFVFKLIPMLCPDGVARGHFRLDQFGVNLNRAYGCPSKRDQPSIYAAKHVIKQVATLCSPLPVRLTPAAAAAGVTGAARAQPPLQTSGLALYLDLHGFSARSGCYLLGNAMQPGKAARALTFATLLQLYAPQFNAAAASIGKQAPGAAALAAGGRGSGVPVTERDAAAQSSRMAAVSSLRAALVAAAGAAASGASGGSKIVRPPQLYFADAAALAALRAALLALTTATTSASANSSGAAAAGDASGRLALPAPRGSPSPSPPPGGSRSRHPSTDSGALAPEGSSLSGGGGSSVLLPLGSEDEREDGDSTGGGGASVEEDSCGRVVVEPVDGVEPGGGEGTAAPLPSAGGVAAAEEEEEAAEEAGSEDDDASDSDAGEGGDEEGEEDGEDDEDNDPDGEEEEEEEEGGGGRAGRSGRRARRGAASRTRRAGSQRPAVAGRRSSTAATPLPAATPASPAAAAPKAAPAKTSVPVLPAATKPRIAAASEAETLAFFCAPIPPVSAPLSPPPPPQPPAASYEEAEAAALAAAVAAVGPGVAVSIVPRTAPGATAATATATAAAAAAGGGGGGGSDATTAAPPSPALRLLDPTAVYSPTLPIGVRGGPAEASLHEVEYRRLTREWRAMKERVQLAAMSQPVGAPGAAGSSGKGELRKGGTGRARVAREYGTTLAFTVECSCNLLSHGLALHRACMFKHGDTTTSGAAPDPAPLTPDLRFPLLAPYLSAHEEFYLHPASAAVAISNASSGINANSSSSGIDTALLVCPAAARAGVSQRHEAPRVYEALPPPSATAASPSLQQQQLEPWLPAPRGRTQPAPYMCAVDSLQPPAPHRSGSAAAAATAGSTAVLIDPAATAARGAAAAAGGGTSGSPSAAAALQPRVEPSGLPAFAHAQPFGGCAVLPAAPLAQPPLGTVVCGWGTCPNDPPAVFAAAGRAVGFALLDMFGLTAARDPALAPPAGPAPAAGAVTALRSKLSETVWGDLPGLHAWSRVVTGAEPKDASAAPPPPAAAAATTSDYLRRTALTPLVRPAIARLLASPPHGYISAVTFPLLRASPWRLAHCGTLAPPTGAELIPYLPHTAFIAAPAPAPVPAAGPSPSPAAALAPGQQASGLGVRGLVRTRSTSSGATLAVAAGSSSAGAGAPPPLLHISAAGSSSSASVAGASAGASATAALGVSPVSSPLRAAGQSVVGGSPYAPPQASGPNPQLPTADLGVDLHFPSPPASSSNGSGSSSGSPYAAGGGRGAAASSLTKRRPGHHGHHHALHHRRDAAAVAAGQAYLAGGSGGAGAAGSGPAAAGGGSPSQNGAGAAPRSLPLSSNLLMPGINAEAFLAPAAPSPLSPPGALPHAAAAAASATPLPPLTAAGGTAPVLAYSTLKLIKAFSTALQLQPALDGAVAAIGVAAGASSSGGSSGGGGGSPGRPARPSQPAPSPQQPKN